MIKNLKDKLCQLQSKQAKGAKFRANIRYKLEENRRWSCFKTFFNILERQDIHNETIFELYTDDNQSKYFSNPTDILKSAKKIMKNSTSKESAT